MAVKTAANKTAPVTMTEDDRRGTPAPVNSAIPVAEAALLEAEIVNVGVPAVDPVVLVIRPCRPR